jgi:hypothetical protein
MAATAANFSRVARPAPLARRGAVGVAIGTPPVPVAAIGVGTVLAAALEAGAGQSGPPGQTTKVEATGTTLTALVAATGTTLVAGTAGQSGEPGQMGDGKATGGTLDEPAAGQSGEPGQMGEGKATGGTLDEPAAGALDSGTGTTAVETDTTISVVDRAATGAVVSGVGVTIETIAVVLTGTTVEVTDPTGQTTPAGHAVTVYDWVA